MVLQTARTRIAVWFLAAAAVGILAALVARATEEQWCTSGPLGNYGALHDLLVAVVFTGVAVAFLIVSLVLGLLGRTWQLPLAIALGIGAGWAASTVVAPPGCPPTGALSAGTVDIVLGAPLSQRLSGDADCSRDIESGELVDVRQGTGSDEAWTANGWVVIVSLDDFWTPGPAQSGSFPVQLEQASANPFTFAYELADGAQASTEIDPDGNRGVVSFRNLILQTFEDSDPVPFDPERQTDPNGLPKTLDVLVEWSCPAS